MKRCHRCNQKLYSTRRYYDPVCDDVITEDVAHYCYGKMRIITHGIMDKHKIFMKRLRDSKSSQWEKLRTRRECREEVFTPAMMSPLEIGMRWELHQRMKRGVR